MKIANNILRYYLRNVYFLCGTACGGKTTLSKALAQKHGLLLYEENATYAISKLIADRQNQPAQCTHFPSWEFYFNRPYQQYHQWLQEVAEEQLPVALIELIKLAEHQRVVADMHMPVQTALSISERERIVFLVAEPDLVVKDYYHRPDHKDFYDCIMALPEPEKALCNISKMLKYGTEMFLKELYQSDVFYLLRDETSTIENRLQRVEKHFGLS